MIKDRVPRHHTDDDDTKRESESPQVVDRGPKSDDAPTAFKEALGVVRVAMDRLVKARAKKDR